LLAVVHGEHPMRLLGPQRLPVVLDIAVIFLLPEDNSLERR